MSLRQRWSSVTPTDVSAWMCPGTLPMTAAVERLGPPTRQHIASREAGRMPFVTLIWRRDSRLLVARFAEGCLGAWAGWSCEAASNETDTLGDVMLRPGRDDVASMQEALGPPSGTAVAPFVPDGCAGALLWLRSLPGPGRAVLSSLAATFDPDGRMLAFWHTTRPGARRWDDGLSGLASLRLGIPVR